MSVVIVDAAESDLEARVCEQSVLLSSPGFRGLNVRGLNCTTQAQAMQDESLGDADVFVIWHTLKADSALIAKLSNARAIVRVGVIIQTTSTHIDATN